MLWALVAAALSGCLVPQDDQVLPTIPPERNHPPRIVLETATPDPKITIGAPSTMCKPPDFQAVVEDIDLSDQIRQRWFVDVFAPYSGASGYPAATIPPGDKPQRNSQVKAPASMFNDDALKRLGIHRVEVVISDGEFLVDAPGAPGLSAAPRSYVVPDGDGGTTTVYDPSYLDSYVWEVEITAGCTR